VKDESDGRTSLFIGVAVAAAISVSLATSAYVGWRVSETHKVGSALQTEIAELRNVVRAALPRGDVAAAPPRGDKVSKANLSSSACGDNSAGLRALQTKIGDLANDISAIRVAIQNGFASQDITDNQMGPAPNLPPQLSSSPNPEKLMALQFGNHLSDELRQKVDAVLQHQAEVAQQKIEALSGDPMNPRLEDVLSVMDESDKQIAAELRKILPRKDFEELFPKEVESEKLPSQDDNF
jgi:hypothetical protein